MTIPEAEAIVGGPLGRPSKMPCPAWGISAVECRRGSLLRGKPNTVCSSCYARRGHYTGGSVETAHERRLEALGDPRWPDAMAVLVEAYARGDYFRWFDSGDLQSPQHLDWIFWIARRTSTTRHWLPTREKRIVGPFVERVPPNLVVRLSADMIGEPPKTPTWELPTSTVHRDPGRPVPTKTGRAGDSIECPSHLHGHRCGSCRACWSPKVRNVSYLLNAGLRSSVSASAPHRLSLPVLP
jgi:hypothetical protein